MKKEVKKETVSTMKIKKSTIQRLRKFEVHPREPHEEILIRLITEEERRNG